MANFRETTVTTIVDENGIEKSTMVEKNINITRNDEPDYIKVYTNMWAEFTGIPVAYRELFLQLATRMTYCNSSDLKNAQLVNTAKPFSLDIMEAMKWKIDMYNKGLKELVKCGAIKRVGRGVYQINPSYAGKGEWKYNPRLDRGGVEDLVAVFNFKDKTIDTNILWADDGEENDLNKIYREGMGVKASDETVITNTVVTPIPTIEKSDPPQEEKEERLPKATEHVYPKTKEDCKTHEDCLAFVYFVKQGKKPGAAYHMAKDMGIETLGKKDVDEIWQRFLTIDESMAIETVRS